MSVTHYRKHFNNFRELSCNSSTIAIGIIIFVKLFLNTAVSSKFTFLRNFCSECIIFVRLLCRNLKPIAHISKGSYVCFGSHNLSNNNQVLCRLKLRMSPALLFLLLEVLGPSSSSAGLEIAAREGDMLLSSSAMLHLQSAV